MAANMPLFETPQDVLRRLQQQRQEAYMSGNPMAILAANTQAAVDALVGNPELKRARNIQEKLAAAVGKIPEGASELDQELGRLRAARDVYAEQGDIMRASALNTQVLQLQTMKMEQDKLKADTVRIQNEETRQQEMHPLQVAKEFGEANEYVNWLNPKTGKTQAVHEADVEIQQRLSEQGYIRQGLANVQGTPADFGMTKPVLTDLQTAVLESRGQQQNLRDIMRQYNPAFTEYGTQLMNFGVSKLEKIVGEENIPSAAKERMGQYVQWRRNTRDALNRYIKYITGAQMSQFEIKRIQGAFPTEDNSHTEFMGNMRETMRQAMQAEKRASMALRLGLNVKDGDELSAKLGDLSTFEVSDQEVDAVLGTGAVALKPDKGLGWRDLGNGVRIRVKPAAQ